VHDTVALKMEDGERKEFGVIESLYENLADQKKFVQWKKFFTYKMANPTRLIENPKQKQQLYLSDWEARTEISSILNKIEVFSKGTMRTPFFCEHSIVAHDTENKTPIKGVRVPWNQPGETTRERIRALSVKVATPSKKKSMPNDIIPFEDKFMWCTPLELENGTQTYSSCLFGTLFVQINSFVKLHLKGKQPVIGQVTGMREKISTGRSSLYVEKYEIDLGYKNDSRCIEKIGAEWIDVGDISKVETAVIVHKKVYDKIINSKQSKAIENLYFLFM
jgi:hypothetical protein